jgi:hypothetical protein
MMTEASNMDERIGSCQPKAFDAEEPEEPLSA